MTVWRGKRQALELFPTTVKPMLTVEKPISFGTRDRAGGGISWGQILMICQTLVIVSLFGWIVYAGQSLDGLPSPVVVSTLVGLLAGGSLVYLLDRWKSRERKVLKRLLELME